MSRESNVRRQKSAMEYAITAGKRGDHQAVHGAIAEVVRAGKAMGIRTDPEARETPPLTRSRGSGQIIEPPRRTRSTKRYFC